MDKMLAYLNKNKIDYACDSGDADCDQGRASRTARVDIVKGVYVELHKQTVSNRRMLHTLTKEGVHYEFASMANAADYLGISSALIGQYFNAGRSYDGWVILRDGKPSPRKAQIDKLKAGIYVPYDEQCVGANGSGGYTLLKKDKAYFFKTAELAAYFLGVARSTFNHRVVGTRRAVMLAGYSVIPGVDKHNITE